MHPSRRKMVEQQKPQGYVRANKKKKNFTSYRKSKLKLKYRYNTTTLLGQIIGFQNYISRRGPNVQSYNLHKLLHALTGNKIVCQKFSPNDRQKIYFPNFILIEATDQRMREILIKPDYNYKMKSLTREILIKPHGPHYNYSLFFFLPHPTNSTKGTYSQVKTHYYISTIEASKKKSIDQSKSFSINTNQLVHPDEDSYLFFLVFPIAKS